MEGVHKDRERFREMVLPADIPPKWKGVQEVIKEHAGCFKILMEANENSLEKAEYSQGTV